MSIELTYPEDYSREELINGEVVLMAPALPPTSESREISSSFLEAACAGKNALLSRPE